MGANFGKNYRISLFGESHGTALGVNIDGIPAGTELDLEFISQEMKRRAPGDQGMQTGVDLTDIMDLMILGEVGIFLVE